MCGESYKVSSFFALELLGKVKNPKPERNTFDIESAPPIESTHPAEDPRPRLNLIVS